MEAQNNIAQLSGQYLLFSQDSHAVKVNLMRKQVIIT